MNKTYMITAGVMALMTSAVAEFGPVANEADQFRGIWDFKPDAYEEIRDAGFNLFIGGPGCTAASEKMAKDKIGFMLQMGHIPGDGKMKKKYPRSNFDGSKDERTMDATAPGALDDLRKGVLKEIEKMKGNPAFVGIQPASELCLWTHPSFDARHAAAWKAYSGKDVPASARRRESEPWTKLKDLPADRIIDDDYAPYAFYRWFWTIDDGFNNYFNMAIDEFEKAYGRKLFTMYDPSTRRPPLWGAGGKVTHIDDWQVVNPFPSQNSYVVAKEQSMARGRPGQKVLTIVQGIYGRYDSCPIGEFPEGAGAWTKDRPKGAYITPPEDMMRESLWAVESHQIDGVLVHGWNCIFDGAPYGVSKEGGGYQYTHAETKRMLSKFFKEVMAPLGPLFKAAPERAPVVAVYECAPSAILSGRAPYDWKGGITYHAAGIVATYAGLNPYTIYDEEILRDGIPSSVKVILAPMAQVITKSVAAKLREFQARGGKILGWEDMAPGIKADGVLPPTRYEKMNYGVGSHNDKNFAGDKLVALMRQAASEYRAAVKPIVGEFFTECDNPMILTRARKAGAADLVFAWNTKRQYGPYIGPWKRDLEKTVPQNGKVVVATKAGAVYDLVAHAETKFEVKDGKTYIPVNYDAEKGGNAFLVTAKPLAKLEYTVEEKAAGLKITVTSKDKDVMIPVTISVGGGEPFSAVLKNGVFSREFDTKGVVRVTNLADGALAVKPSAWWQFWK